MAVTQASSASLTSLPSIDFSLDIELPPPITCQILPSTSHTLPHKHRQGEQADRTPDDRSSRHYYRSPKPYTSDNHHYSTLPRTLPSAVTKTPRPGAAYVGRGRPQVAANYGCAKTNMSAAANCYSEGREQQSYLPRKPDVVSLYGTADEFKTRMLYPKSAPEIQAAARRDHARKNKISSKPTKLDDIALPLTKNRRDQSTSSSGTRKMTSWSEETAKRSSSNGTNRDHYRHDGSSSERRSYSRGVTSSVGEQVRVSSPKVAHYLDRSVSFGSCSMSRPKWRGVNTCSSVSNSTVATSCYSTLGRIKDIPKYDASRAFSDSLAAFTSRGNNSEYFYSSLNRSRGGSLAHIDNDNLEEASDSFFELSHDSLMRPSHPNDSVTSFQLGPYKRYDPSNQGVRHDAGNDIMTMSLPPGLASINSLTSDYKTQTLEPLYSSSSRFPSLYSSLTTRRATNTDTFHSLPHTSTLDNTSRSAVAKTSVARDNFLAASNREESLPAFSREKSLPSSFRKKSIGGSYKDTYFASTSIDESLPVSSMDKHKVPCSHRDTTKYRDKKCTYARDDCAPVLPNRSTSLTSRTSREYRCTNTRVGGPPSDPPSAPLRTSSLFPPTGRATEVGVGACPLITVATPVVHLIHGLLLLFSLPPSQPSH